MARTKYAESELVVCIESYVDGGDPETPGYARGLRWSAATRRSRSTPSTGFPPRLRTTRSAAFAPGCTSTQAPSICRTDLGKGEFDECPRHRP
jgi:hypothetical protein